MINEKGLFITSDTQIIDICRVWLYKYMFYQICLFYISLE